MLWRGNFQTACIAFCLGVFTTLFVSRLYSYPDTNKLTCIKVDQEDDHSIVKTDDRNDNLLPPTLIKSDKISSNDSTEQRLQKTRSIIKREMELLNYNFTYSGVDKLEDLLMESGGNPLRSIIISTWRSGSSFLGDLLHAMPSSFYTFEPLIDYESSQVRGPPKADQATRTIKNILKCNFSDENQLIWFIKNKMNYTPFKYNTRMWSACESNHELCADVGFLSKICKLFPFHTMKSVRYRLHLVKSLLEDNELNVKVVVLVRDPRGVMHSRRIQGFCKKNPDCWEPKLLCDDMVGDYVAAGQFLQEYPDRLMVLRYEDFILNLTSTTFELLKFLQLDHRESFEKFLDAHTNVQTGNGFSTFRVSRTVPFKWKNQLNFDSIQDIQGSCKEAMEMWGYELVQNATHMAREDFNPLLPYSVKVVKQ